MFFRKSSPRTAISSTLIYRHYAIRTYYGVSTLARVQRSIQHTYRVSRGCIVDYNTRIRQIRDRNSAVPSALLPPTTLRQSPPSPIPDLSPAISTRRIGDSHKRTESTYMCARHYKSIYVYMNYIYLQDRSRKENH